MIDNRIDLIRSAALFSLLPLGLATAHNTIHSFAGVNVQGLHEDVELQHFFDMRIGFFSAKRNPLDVVFVILALIHTNLDLVLQSSILSLVFLSEAVKVVNVVPKKMFLRDVFVKFFVVFFELYQQIITSPLPRPQI